MNCAVGKEMSSVVSHITGGSNTSAHKINISYEDKFMKINSDAVDDLSIFESDLPTLKQNNRNSC